MEGEDGGWDNYKQILSARATQRLFGAADAKRELKAPFSSSNFPLPAQKNWHFVCVCVCAFTMRGRRKHLTHVCIYGYKRRGAMGKGERQI